MNEETKSQTSMTEARFGHTRWTLIVKAQTAEAHQSLEQLCRIYWPPLYGFLRKLGYSKQDAEDLVQGFFAQLLKGNGLSEVDPKKGKFRSFLLVGLKYHLRDQWAKRCAVKRGGGDFPIPLPDETAAWPSDPGDDPAEAYDKQWALALISEVMRRLSEDCAAPEKRRQLEVLQPYLTGEVERGNYSSAASILQMSEGAVRVTVHRLRGDFQTILREEVRRTVSSEAEIEGEISELVQVLRRPNRRIVGGPPSNSKSLS